LRDIGTHFSNTDPAWAGKDSKYFLREVTRMLTEKGWKIENVDCTLTLEQPKIKPHIDHMREVLAPLMNISVDDVSLKATTSEKLGYVGRQEGLNAYAVALISKP
jgi:2-C-methyl-D-erythritol 2,4-cyclodiphosphate synthase